MPTILVFKKGETLSVTETPDEVEAEFEQAQRRISGLAHLSKRTRPPRPVKVNPALVRYLYALKQGASG